MPDQKSAEQQPGERDTSVFLNLPYDNSYEDLFLAYIAGVSVFGLTPHAALEDSTSKRRLDRIHELIQGCAYSIHDLSLMKLQVDPKRPRLNMPFELGLAVAEDIGCAKKHRWFIFVKELRSFKGSLSDLDGTDVQIHGGDPAGVFGKLMNIFSSPNIHTSVSQMENTYQMLKMALPLVVESNGATSIFEASVFRQLSAIARSWVSVFAVSDLKENLGRETLSRLKHRK
jgi:hypothetical protein